GDCFEITEFHMQLKKGNIILKINTLRCMLRELQFEIFEIYKDNNLKNTIMTNVNSIINSLSQLICLAVGGEECQRKI
ncbi:ATP:cob(I)alamin adenosyltransferase, partial [Clostridium botulinum C str. Stockholm]